MFGKIRKGKKKFKMCFFKVGIIALSWVSAWWQVGGTRRSVQQGTQLIERGPTGFFFAIGADLASLWL